MKKTLRFSGLTLAFAVISVMLWAYDRAYSGDAVFSESAATPAEVHAHVHSHGFSSCCGLECENESVSECESVPCPALTRPGARAMLCNDCGFGNRKDNCVKCGKWMGGTKVPAYLCSDCGFGNRKDNCVKCGKWLGSGGTPAFICGDCGFGNRKENCVKCGKWMGGM